MKTSCPLFLAVCAIFAGSVAQATTVIPPTFDDLVSQAQIILQGTVTDVQSQWTGEGAQRHIVSYVTVQVEETLKGEPGANYTLRMLGGTVDGTTMEVSDSPKFKIGDRDILFVENNGTQFIPLVGIMHGRFHLEQDSATGAETVKTHNGEALTDLAQLGKDEHGISGNKTNPDAATTAKPLDAAAFKAAIRSKLSNATK